MEPITITLSPIQAVFAAFLLACILIDIVYLVAKVRDEDGLKEIAFSLTTFWCILIVGLLLIGTFLN